jgi:uncharacterized protein (TIGR03067 family)
MRWRTIALLGILLAAGRGTGGADDAKKELKKFQGTWKVARMDVDGIKMPQEAFEKVTVLIEGDRLSFLDKGKVYEEIECVLDPAKKPREIDMHYVLGLKKGVLELGIYEVEGNTLRICQSLTRKKRPSELTSAKGSAQQLMVLKRVQP